MLNEIENSLLCLGHDTRVKNIQIMLNQELSSKNSKCLPNELDVLGQISAIEGGRLWAMEIHLFIKKIHI